MSALEKAPTILTPAGARSLTDRISRNLASVDADLARAWECQVWEPLGHASWSDWCAAELPELTHLRLAIPVRLERVKALREAGASERAIADACGVSPALIHADLVKLRDAGELREPATVTSLDSRRRPSQQPATAVEPEPREVAQAARGGLTLLLHEGWQYVDRGYRGRPGMTCLELEKTARWRHGRASSVLHRLERAGVVRRDREQVRDGYTVYLARPLD